ncbi:K(+)-transporting ATPase subunit F [Frateuria aurantia]
MTAMYILAAALAVLLAAYLSVAMLRPEWFE